MVKKQYITDTQMLKLIDILKENGTIRFTQQYLNAIGMVKQNIRAVRIGILHFTPDQIFNACKEYNVNANWILGLEEEVFRSKRRINKDSTQTETQTKLSLLQ